jgi:type II secretory pathway component PulC
MRILAASVALFGLTLAVSACGGGATEAASPKSSAAPRTAPTTTAAAVETTSLKRSQVKGAVAQGLGVLLQHVELDDWPVMRDGKFYGFRIKALDPSWNIGLAPGDVVTRVNGMPIEHPEEADAALRSLEKAPKLRIDFEREGKPRVVELPITDD